MSKKTLKKWQYRLLLLLSEHKSKGFTLLELLVAVIVSSLVVSGLLYVVTELLRIDNRESALEEVQRDTQRAINYVGDELREAIYVYSTPVTVTNTTTGVGSVLPTGSTPILAFWKVTPLASNEMPGVCSTSFTSDPEKSACRALKIRRSSYDLVVYAQISGPAAPWKGQSRISRYVLQQYTDASKLKETPGFVNPGLTQQSFEGWVRGAGTLPSNGSAVLVDYIDGLGSASAPAANCQVLIPGSSKDEYILSPPTAKEDSSFFACIRDPDSAAQQLVQFTRSNQDVYLFLRGDVSARSASVNPASDISRSPMLQTQVLIRGVLNKSPTD